MKPPWKMSPAPVVSTALYLKPGKRDTAAAHQAIAPGAQRNGQKPVEASLEGKGRILPDPVFRSIRPGKSALAIRKSTFWIKLPAAGHHFIQIRADRYSLLPAPDCRP